MKSSRYFGRKPNPVPTFLEFTLPSLAKRVNLSRVCRVVKPTRFATQDAWIVASSQHSVKPCTNCSSDTVSLKTMLHDKRQLRYIYLIMSAYLHRPNHDCIIRYIYQIRRISTKGDLRWIL